MQRNLPRVIEQLLCFLLCLMIFEGLEPPLAHLWRQRIADRKQNAITQQLGGHCDVISTRFLIQVAFEIASIF